MSVILRFTFHHEDDDVVPVMSLQNSLGEFSSGSDTLLLGPGYVAVGNGQVALPGSGLDGPAPISQSVSSVPSLSASTSSQDAITLSQSSSPTAFPSMSTGFSPAISVSSLAVLPSVSISPPVRLTFSLHEAAS